MLLLILICYDLTTCLGGNTNTTAYTFIFICGGMAVYYVAKLSPLQCVGTTGIDYLPWVKTVVRMGIGISWDGYQSHTTLDDTKGILHLECL